MEILSYSQPKYSSYAEDVMKNYVPRPLSPEDAATVLRTQAMIQMEQMMGEGITDIQAAQKVIDAIILKYKLPNISVLIQAIRSPIKTQFMNSPKIEQPKVQTASAVVTDDDDSCVSSEEVNEDVKKPTSLANYLAQFCATKVLKVSYMGTTFEFNTWTEASEFAEARGCPPPRFGTAEGLLGGVRKNITKKRKIRPKRTNARKRNVPLKRIVSSGGNPRAPEKGEFMLYFEANMTTTAAGTIDYSFNVNSPNQALNQTGTYDQAQPIADLYEGYKPKEWYVHVDQTAPMIARQGYFIMAYDPDSLPSTTALSERELQQYRYMKKCNAADRIIDFPIIQKAISEGEYTPLGADPSLSIVLDRKIYDFLTPMSTGTAYLKYVGGPATTVIGKVKLTLIIEGKYPRFLGGSALYTKTPKGMMRRYSQEEVKDIIAKMYATRPLGEEYFPESLPQPVVPKDDEWTDQDQKAIDKLKAEYEKLSVKKMVAPNLTRRSSL